MFLDTLKIHDFLKLKGSVRLATNKTSQTCFEVIYCGCHKAHYMHKQRQKGVSIN
jgi:hypothetical protein